MSAPFRLSWSVDRRQLAHSQTSDAAEEGLVDAAEFLLEQANRTVPHEEGTLARSGTVSADGLKAAVAYDTPYARRQHEDTRLRHDQGRRAKWLELTLREQKDQILNFLAERIRRSM